MICARRKTHIGKYWESLRQLYFEKVIRGRKALSEGG